MLNLHNTAVRAYICERESTTHYSRFTPTYLQVIHTTDYVNKKINKYRYTR